MEVTQLKIIRIVFQDIQPRFDPTGQPPKCVLVLDMEDQKGLCTNDVPCIAEKLEKALPGIFPDENSPVDHSCGGRGSDVEKHSFREEIERGTNIPHLLEHVLIYLLSRRSNHCAAYCGQRSVDLEQGIDTHYYLVMECPSELEAVVAIDLGFQIVSALINGSTMVIDPVKVLDGIQRALEPMVNLAA
ncbi:MAG: hypothetical protein ABFD46_04565 [Armatimonadota bacterium]